MDLVNLTYRDLSVTQYSDDYYLHYVVTLPIPFEPLIDSLADDGEYYAHVLTALLARCVAKVFIEKSYEDDNYEQTIQLCMQTSDCHFLLDVLLSNEVNLNRLKFSRHLRKHSEFNGLSIDFDGNFLESELGGLKNTHFVAMRQLRLRNNLKALWLESLFALHLHRALNKAILFNGDFQVCGSDNELVIEHISEQHENFYRDDYYEPLLELRRETSTGGDNYCLLYARNWMK
ncbi:hypothetical protein ACP6H1_23340 [Vibrio harveyi]|uniref:hypothetical protein n=1 Tax=Vibrio harveyi group TaxID=717610 RepID=UPI0021CE939F